MRLVWQTFSIILLVPIFLLLYNKTFAIKNKQQLDSNTGLQNLRAFLLMIQYAEGTLGPNAYRTLFGGRLINSLEHHPNITVTIGGFSSTAAGAYQFLYSTWSNLQQTLRLTDFSPSSQDRAAVEIIWQKGALADVLAGNTVAAIYKCRKVWASFPGAGYGQGEKSLDAMMKAYTLAGGQYINLHSNPAAGA
ncbi:glycoside hydrolase family 24 protein [Chitinophaga agri]|nr:glycoside hydrolase family 104 protein [Chitinophaga agri]